MNEIRDHALTLKFMLLEQVRQQIINQQNGSSYMMVKFHLDHKVIPDHILR